MANHKVYRITGSLCGAYYVIDDGQPVVGYAENEPLVPQQLQDHIPCDIAGFLRWAIEHGRTVECISKDDDHADG